jgi:hypothetical protein
MVPLFCFHSVKKESHRRACEVQLQVSANMCRPVHFISYSSTTFLDELF